MAGIADWRHMPKLGLPATPEVIRTAIEDICVRDASDCPTRTVL